MGNSRLGSAIGKIRNFTEYTSSIIYTMGYDTAPCTRRGNMRIIYNTKIEKMNILKIGGML